MVEMDLFRCIQFAFYLILVAFQTIGATCPEISEEIIIDKESTNITWTWNKLTGRGESSPVCIFDGKIKYRECFANGKWGVAQMCQEIRNVSKKCPPNFKTFFLESLNSTICYMFTSEHEGPAKCPYPNPLDDEQFNVLVPENNITLYWLPLKRNLTNGIGVIENIYTNRPTKREIPYEGLEDYLEKNCVVFNLRTKKSKIENCTQGLPSFCAYLQSYDTRIRINNSSWTNCKYVINKPTECFYEENSQQLVSKEKLCQFPDQLAKPSLENQNALLNANNNEISRGCWFNLPKDNQFLDKNNVSTLEDTLGCAHCQRNSFYPSDLKLILHDHNVTAIVKLEPADIFDIKYINLECFTNSAPELVKAVNLNCTLQDSCVFNKDLFGMYWCNALLPGLPLLTSNTLIRSDQIEKYAGFKYVPIIVESTVTVNLNEFKWQDLTNVEVKFCKFFLNLANFQKCSVMRVNNLEFYPHGNLQFKIIVLATVGRGARITAAMKLNGANATDGVRFNETKVRKLQCEENVTFSNNYQLDWPEAVIGETVVAERYYGCLVASPRDDIVRTCQGDLLNSAKWGQVEGECREIQNCSAQNTNSGNYTLQWPQIMEGESHTINHAECFHINPIRRHCLKFGIWGEVMGQCYVPKNCSAETTLSGILTLHWVESAENQTREIDEKKCFNSQPPYDPVSRECKMGGVWGDVIGKCRETSTIDIRTEEVYSVLRTVEIDTDSGLEAALSVSEKSGLRSEDVDVLVQTLRLTNSNQSPETRSPKDVEKRLKVVSNVMNNEQNVLSKAQDAQNTTDVLLNLVEDILSDALVGRDGILSVTTDNIVSQVCDFRKKNYAWMTLESEYDESATAIRGWKNLEDFEKPEEIVSQMGKQEVMIQVPTFVNANKNSSKTTIVPKLSVTMYKNTSLFNEARIDNSSTKTIPAPNNRVVSITAKDSGSNQFVDVVEGSFGIYFNLVTSAKGCNNYCAYWDYGAEKKGRWKEDGRPEYRIIDGVRYALCSFNHTTHFTVLVGVTIDPRHEIILNVITIIGSTLSSIGLLAIILTALISRSWRSDSGHYILLQFSVIVLLKYILLHLSSKFQAKQNEECLTGIPIFCYVIATLLHYILLSEFSWMLILAILQYKRFVNVFNAAISESMVGLSIAGWTIPIIPALGVFVVNKYILAEPMYNPKFCYPIGLTLYVGILLPIVLIVIVNLGIFSTIIFAIVKSKVQLKGKLHGNQSQNILKLSLRLAIFLFFLLGFSWIFGLMAALNIGQIAFAYLFCITATLQGVVMFLYFVVWNEKTRKLWLRILQCGKFKSRIDLLTDFKTSGDTNLTQSSNTKGVTFKSLSDREYLVEDSHDLD